jgi:1-acyl-sn-glycerol-3-phosphate acyltransferase
VARKRARTKGNAWVKAGELALIPLTHLIAKRRYAGALRIPETGGALIVANHISHVDPIFDTVFIRSSGRIPHVMAKASLWKIPVVRRVLTGTGQIPVERGGGAGQAALEQTVASLAAGHVVLIYPEGTVTKDPDGWPMRPRPGVAALALSGDFPVIPVAHWGSNHVYTSYASGMRFKPFPRKDVHVVAGEPIDLSEWRGKPVDNRAIRDVSYLIMGRVRDMVAQLRGETAPAAFFNPKTGSPETTTGETTTGETGSAGSGTPESRAAPPGGPGR